MLQKLIWLALAGALGTLARYALCMLIPRGEGALHSWGTVIVNVVGCLLAGIVWSLSESHFHVDGHLRPIVLIGFMGAFTTFSAFMLETGEMLSDSAYVSAMGHVALHNGVGVAALFVGLVVGRSYLAVTA